MATDPGESSRRPEPDCTLCAHFYLTWRTPFTHGCRAYAFEAPTYPKIVVQRESGRPCELFEPRGEPKTKSGRGKGRGGERGG